MSILAAAASSQETNSKADDNSLAAGAVALCFFFPLSARPFGSFVHIILGPDATKSNPHPNPLLLSFHKPNPNPSLLSYPKPRSPILNSSQPYTAQAVFAQRASGVQCSVRVCLFFAFSFQHWSKDQADHVRKRELDHHVQHHCQEIRGRQNLQFHSSGSSTPPIQRAHQQKKRGGCGGRKKKKNIKRIFHT